MGDDTGNDISNKKSYRDESRLPRGFANDSANPWNVVVRQTWSSRRYIPGGDSSFDSLTVSSAFVKEEGMWTVSTLCGTVFCTSSAMSTILISEENREEIKLLRPKLSEEDRALCPKETVWNESGFLTFVSLAVVGK